MSSIVVQNETRPNSCGCGKCSVEVSVLSGKFKTRSLQVVAGVHLAKRTYCELNGPQMLLWAQECQPGLSDKIQAIYDFCECSRILEYADKFGYWQEAVRAVRHTLATAAKNTNAEIHVEVVDTFTYRKETIKVRPNDDVQKFITFGYYHAKITFRQQTLQPGKTIASYGITDGSQVQVG